MLTSTGVPRKGACSDILTFEHDTLLFSKSNLSTGVQWNPHWDTLGGAPLGANLQEWACHSGVRSAGCLGLTASSPRATSELRPGRVAPHDSSIRKPSLSRSPLGGLRAREDRKVLEALFWAPPSSQVPVLQC